MVETIQWTPDGVVMIDQTRLPREEVFVTCKDYKEVAEAIRSMIIRGAPAIGVAAAMGVAIGVLRAEPAELDRQFEEICRELAGTRPTAVNLFWAIDRMKQVYAGVEGRPIEEIRERLVQEAKQIYLEDIAINEAIGKHGAELVPDGKTVLTHCNAGALATAGYGTALGVIRAAISAGKKIDVFADETRPFLQGARLTVWELAHDGIPATLITDNMAGHFLKSGRIGCVVVGADRIAANGDVANKIGTYSVAVLARENHVPFYVAAPISTLDLTLASGDEIPIEERAASEVTHVHGVPVAPEGVAVANPAFDVTPAKYVTAIITERGVAWAPFKESLRRLAANEPAPQASIEHVSDTALLVAACRAMETELEDGFVRDPFAARLAGERGPALAHEVDASKWLAFGIGIRSRFIDDLLLDLVRRGEIDTVVNMGAGLDTRPWRLDLPESLLWIEVDFPDILAYKEEKLEGTRPKCRHQTLTADLTDPEQRRRVLESSAGTRALLMTEGLLTYLPGETVRALAGDAHGYRYWLLDVISNWMMSALPGRNWAPFDRVRSKTRLSGDEILEAAKKVGWKVAANRRNIVEGFQLGHARLMRMVQESAARGETRRESPPADDVSGVWLFSRE